VECRVIAGGQSDYRAPRCTLPVTPAPVRAYGSLVHPIHLLHRHAAVSAVLVFGCIDDWVKKCMEHEVEGSRPRGRPKKTRKEVVREDCQARKLNKEDAVDRCKWRKVIKEAR